MGIVVVEVEEEVEEEQLRRAGSNGTQVCVYIIYIRYYIAKMIVRVYARICVMRSGAVSGGRHLVGGTGKHAKYNQTAYYRIQTNKHLILFDIFFPKPVRY